MESSTTPSNRPALIPGSNGQSGQPRKPVTLDELYDLLIETKKYVGHKFDLLAKSNIIEACSCSMCSKRPSSNSSQSSSVCPSLSFNNTLASFGPITPLSVIEPPTLLSSQHVPAFSTTTPAQNQTSSAPKQSGTKTMSNESQLEPAPRRGRKPSLDAAVISQIMVYTENHTILQTARHFNVSIGSAAYYKIKARNEKAKEQKSASGARIKLKSKATSKSSPTMQKEDELCEELDLASIPIPNDDSLNDVETMGGTDGTTSPSTAHFPPMDVDMALKKNVQIIQSPDVVAPKDAEPFHALFNQTSRVMAQPFPAHLNQQNPVHVIAQSSHGLSGQHQAAVPKMNKPFPALFDQQFRQHVGLLDPQHSFFQSLHRQNGQHPQSSYYRAASSAKGGVNVPTQGLFPSAYRQP